MKEMDILAVSDDAPEYEKNFADKVNKQAAIGHRLIRKAEIKQCFADVLMLFVPRSIFESISDFCKGVGKKKAERRSMRYAHRAKRFQDERDKTHEKHVKEDVYPSEIDHRKISEDLVHHWAANMEAHPTIYIDFYDKDEQINTFVFNEDGSLEYYAEGKKTPEPVCTGHFFNPSSARFNIDIDNHLVVLSYSFGPLHGKSMDCTLLYENGKWKLGDVIKVNWVV